jgi:hypothetical protein
VPAEIGREEPDTQPAIRIGDILVESSGGPQRLCVLPIVLGVGIGET